MSASLRLATSTPLTVRRAAGLLLSLVLGCSAQGSAGQTSTSNTGDRGGGKGGASQGRPGGGPPGKGPGAGGPGANVAADPMAVRTTTLAAHDLATYYRSSGTLSARRSAELRPVQAGIIIELRAEEGDRVKEGQVLARLDAREIELQAQREAINANNAQFELNRIESIADLDAIALQEIDKQRFAVEQAQATTKLTAHQVSQRVVRAPFSGIITARRVHVGNLASTGSALYDLADVSTLELVLHLPELEAAGVAIGTLVTIETIDKTRFEAKIVRRAPVVDATTGTVKFTAATSTYPPQAMPGAFVRADILLSSKKDALALPNSAIVEVDGKHQVLTIQNGKAQRMTVSLGLRGTQFTEIADGLPADAVVVLEPGEIANGTLLKPAPAVASPIEEKPTTPVPAEKAEKDGQPAKQSGAVSPAKP